MKTIIITGPQGSGKTTRATNLAKKLGLPLVHTSCMNKGYILNGDIEKPCVILCDNSNDIDWLRVKEYSCDSFINIHKKGHMPYLLDVSNHVLVVITPEIPEKYREFKNFTILKQRKQHV